MRRQWKRVFGAVMCGVFAVGSLAGCGGKNQESALRNGIETIRGAKSYEVNMELNADISLSYGDEGDMTVTRLLSDVRGIVFTDPVKVKIIDKSEVTYEETNIVQQEKYIQKEGDDYFLYTGEEDLWGKTRCGGLDEALEEAGMMMKDILPENLSRLKYTQKEDQEEAGVKYHVFEYSFSGGSLKELCERMGIFPDQDEYRKNKEKYQKYVEDILNGAGTVTMTIWVDPDEERIYKIVCPLTDLLNSAYAAAEQDTIKESGGTGDKDEDNVDLEIKDCNLTIRYSNINSAEDFDIPEKVLKAEETKEESEE